MLDLLPLPVKLAFAGIWAFVWHWGIGVVLIVGLLTFAYFTTAIPIIGPFLRDMRSHLLWAAFVIAVFLAGQYVGARDAAQRNEAKTIVIERTVEKAVEHTTTPAAKGKPDRWDRPEY